MNRHQLRQIVKALEEDEQRELCDQRMQGHTSAAEVDAALAQASPQLRELRRHSEPLREAFKQQLFEQMLAPPAAAKLPPPAQGAQGVLSLQDHRRRVRVAWYAVGAALAVAASLAVAVGPRLLTSATPPLLALELSAHTTKSHLGAAASEPKAGDLAVERGGCIKIALRPKERHQQALRTQLFLYQDPARPLPWPVSLETAETGLLRQQGPCAQLPTEAGPGRWIVVATYGRTLPSPEDAAGVAAAGAAAGSGWNYDARPLQIEAAALVPQ